MFLFASSGHDRAQNTMDNACPREPLTDRTISVTFVMHITSAQNKSLRTRGCGSPNTHLVISVTSFEVCRASYSYSSLFTILNQHSRKINFYKKSFYKTKGVTAIPRPMNPSPKWILFLTKISHVKRAICAFFMVQIPYKYQKTTQHAIDFSLSSYNCIIILQEQLFAKAF